VGHPRPWAKLKTPWTRRLWLDALSLVSPYRAVVSWHFDRMERDPDYRQGVDLGMRAAGYAAAKDGDNTTTWHSTIGPRSADAEVLGDMDTLRDRARITERDDPVGSGLVLQFTQQMVGTGITDKAATGDSDKDTAVDDVWKGLRKTLAPAELLSWPALQRMLADRMNADGEIWVKRSKATPAAPVHFEIVEGDRVETPSDVVGWLRKNGFANHEVRKGVERDADSKIVAYWMAKSHPGDGAVPLLFAGNFRPTLASTVRDYERVTTENAKHLHGPGRPGQSRFVTFLHAITQNLRDMDLLIEAAAKRVQIAACLAVFIETAADIPDLVNVTAKTNHMVLDQDLVPGMIMVLRKGEKISTVDPNFPLPDLEVLTKVLARRIGAALGISWRVVLADLGDANFSAARADRIEFEQAAATPRQALIEVLAWIRQTALEDALLRGVEGLAGVAAEDLGKASFIPPKKPYLEPEREAKAAKLSLSGEAGERLMTWEEYYAGRGQDWKEQLRQKLLEEQVENEMRKELGMPPAPPRTPFAAADDKPEETNGKAAGRIGVAA